MGTFSDYLELELLDHVLKVGNYAVPADIYIALSTADPLDDESGIAEPVGGGYARVQVNTWDAAVDRAIANTAAVQFPEASGNWGTITYFAIYDHISAGNFLAHGSLAVSKAIISGLTLTFAAGEIDISFLAAGISNYLANALLDHVFKTSSYTAATNLYVALLTVAGTDAMSGSSIPEPAGGAYARVNHNSWNIAAAGASSNDGAATFPKSTVGWGNIVGCAVLDALTYGNLLIYALLDTNQNIVTGDTPSLQDTSFAVTFD